MTDKTPFDEAFEKLFKDKPEYDLPIRWDGGNYYVALYKKLKQYQRDLGLYPKEKPDGFWETSGLPILWDGQDHFATLYKKRSPGEKQKEFLQASGLSEDEQEDIRQDVKFVCQHLLWAVDKHFRGLPEQAYAEVKQVMERLEKDDPLHVDRDDVNNLPLYRAVKVEEGTTHDRERVFHVPFSLRSKMSTNRYSIPGFPCLYLGTSLELCCREAQGDPDRDLVLAARFKLQTEYRLREQGRLPEKERKPLFDDDQFRIIDLAIKPKDLFQNPEVDDAKDDTEPEGDAAPHSEDGKKTEDRRHFSNDEYDLFRTMDFRKIYLRWYPLLVACSFIRARRNDPFASEYVVPQLVIQWLRASAKDSLVGVRYFSSYSYLASEMGFNYAFPSLGVPYQVRATVTDYCARLAHRFKLTLPRFTQEFPSLAACGAELKDEPGYIQDPAETDKPLPEEYEIPDGETEIGAYAFFRSESLKKITIPDSVTSIGYGAFLGCTNLISIRIPDSVTSISESAFNRCTSLTNIEIPKGVTSIEEGTFYECKGLIGLTIPNSVNSIGERAFRGCTSLTNIEIPDSVTHIRRGAFLLCTSLTSIKIPKSVTSIGNGAFYGCTNLTIYCRAAEQPEGWDSDWSKGVPPENIIWNYTGE